MCFTKDTQSYFIVDNLQLKKILKATNLRRVEFANSVDPDEAAHNELPHPHLHCLPLIFEFSI